ELGALAPNAIYVGRFPNHKAFVVDTRLHPADVIAHDKKDIGLLRSRRLCVYGSTFAGDSDDHNESESTNKGSSRHRCEICQTVPTKTAYRHFYSPLLELH